MIDSKGIQVESLGRRQAMSQDRSHMPAPCCVDEQARIQCTRWDTPSETDMRGIRKL
jgi:hypothetical protein